jgi:hypothetical protein
MENAMKLNIKAFAIAIGIVWSGCLLLVGMANLAWPGYGAAFLDLAASIYPGFHPGNGLASVIVGTLYGLVDGAIGGVIIALLYNTAVRSA